METYSQKPVIFMYFWLNSCDENIILKESQFLLTLHGGTNPEIADLFWTEKILKPQKHLSSVNQAFQRRYSNWLGSKVFPNSCLDIKICLCYHMCLCYHLMNKVKIEDVKKLYF